MADSRVIFISQITAGSKFRTILNRMATLSRKKKNGTQWSSCTEKTDPFKMRAKLSTLDIMLSQLSVPDFEQEATFVNFSKPCKFPRVGDARMFGSSKGTNFFGK
jgi:hypothetical protein